MPLIIEGLLGGFRADRGGAGSLQQELLTLFGYALAGDLPFGLGHVCLCIPISQARRKPVGSALLDRLYFLARLVCLQRLGRLGRAVSTTKRLSANKQMSCGALMSSLHEYPIGDVPSVSVAPPRWDIGWTPEFTRVELLTPQT